MTRERGHTLIEVTIVIACLAILAVVAIPTYRRTSEQARVDACAAALRTVWSAQRAHWLEARTFTDEFDDLRDEGLLDANALSAASWFDFDLVGVSPTTFTASATRTGGAWTGSIVVDETGEITGAVTNGESDVVVPAAK